MASDRIIYMETEEPKNEIPKVEIVKRNGMMHYVLLGDYIMFFVALILGILLNFIFPNTLFNNLYAEYIGVIFLILGPVIILWAQSTSKKLAKNPPLVPTFTSGPYKYTRNPTHSGVIIMMFGFALIVHSVFSLIFLVIADIISRLTVLKKQDKILEDRYGDAFVDYKKKVKDWL